MVLAGGYNNAENAISEQCRAYHKGIMSSEKKEIMSKINNVDTFSTLSILSEMVLARIKMNIY